MKRFISSPLFLLVLLSFFLPFFAIQCSRGDIKLGDVTGVQLATGQAEEELAKDTAQAGGDIAGQLGASPTPGTSPTAPGFPVPAPTPERANVSFPATVQIMAIAAAVIALAGIGLALLAGRAGAIVALVLGLVGIVVLFVLFFTFSGAIFKGPEAEQAKLFFEVKMGIGFWLAAFFFLAAAGTGIWRLVSPNGRAEPMPGTAPTPPPTPA